MQSCNYVESNSFLIPRYTCPQNPIVNLSNIYSTLTAYPNLENNAVCGLMLLGNLAEASWVFASCNKSMLPFVICNKDANLNADEHSVNVETLNGTYVCPQFTIIVEKKCYYFSWQSKGKTENNIRGTYYKERLAKINIMCKFYHIFSTLLLLKKNLIVFSYSSSKTIHVIKLKRYSNIIISKQDIAYIDEIQGFSIYDYQKFKMTFGTLLFKCKSGAYILKDFLCDKSIDCPSDSSDEDYCSCNEINKSQFCKEMKVTDYKKICSHLYYSSMSGNCKKYNDLTLLTVSLHKNHCRIYVKSSTLSQNIPSFKSKQICQERDSVSCKMVSHKNITCGNLKVIDNIQMDDLIPGYGSDTEDDNIYLYKKTNEFPCGLGHNEFYNITDICIYKLNKYQHIIPCRNGAHIQNCEKFECNVMYKCINSYCIPWSTVCDGKWDCPEGTDEEEVNVCGPTLICRNMFKCRETNQVCLHLGNICDEVEDCPSGDDEMLCKFKKVKCPEACNCLFYAISCHGTTNEIVLIDDLNPEIYLSIYLFGFQTPFQTRFVHLFKNVLIMNLPNNHIVHVCNLLNIHCLILDLGSNLVPKIHANCFQTLINLRRLNIQKNLVRLIERNAFKNVQKLAFLNLSDNPLINVPILFEAGALNFRILDIAKTSVKIVDVNTFTNLNIKLIITQSYHICCIAPPQAVCGAYQPWYISCSDILPNSIMKTFFVIVSVLIIILNIISIILHIPTSGSNKEFMVTVISININELLCATYLCFLWIVDITFQGTFSVKEQWWRTSYLCVAAFTIVLWFTFLTQSLLLFLSLSRMLVVLYPIDSKLKNVRYVLKVLVSIYVTTLIFSLLIAFILKNSKMVITTTLCLPFIDPTGGVLLVKVVTWFVSMTQTITSVSIIVFHTVLVAKLKDSQKNIMKSKGYKSNIALLVQLITVSVSNVLCWFPSNAMYIAALFCLPIPQT